MNAMTGLQPHRFDIKPEPFRPAPQLPPGNSFVRTMTARIISSVASNFGQEIAPIDIAQRLFPSDRLVDAVLTRAATAPAMTTVTGWAAELVQRVVLDALDAMGPISGGALLLKEAMVLNFNGAGLITAPGFVASANYASFVAEGLPIPVRQLPAAGVQMPPHKLATIGVLTREMTESSNAEQLIGDVLTRSMGLALDNILFDTNPADAARPAGLRNGIATLTASNNAELHEAFIEDLTTLIGAVSAVGGTRYAVVASPARIATMAVRFLGQVDNLVLIPAASVGNIMIAISLSALVSALSPEPEIDTSGAATLHMSDTPAPLDGGTATPTRSLFQTDAIGLKVRWPVTWALRNAAGLAWLTPAWK